MAHRHPMVKIRVEGKNLADCDFFTKSDPYLILSRPASRGVYEFKQVENTFTDLFTIYGKDLMNFR